MKEKDLIVGRTPTLVPEPKGRVAAFFERLRDQISVKIPKIYYGLENETAKMLEEIFGGSSGDARSGRGSVHFIIKLPEGVDKDKFVASADEYYGLDFDVNGVHISDFDSSYPSTVVLNMKKECLPAFHRALTNVRERASIGGGFSALFSPDSGSTSINVLDAGAVEIGVSGPERFISGKSGRGRGLLP